MDTDNIIEILEGSYKCIKKDFDNLSYKLLQAWPETQIYKGEWLTFGLYQQKQLIFPNSTLCKDTVKALDLIPNIVNAGFSILKPKTIIKPHVGYTNKVFRYHLGINIPSNNVAHCALSIYQSSDIDIELGKINIDFINWNEGKAFKFDDTLNHSAYNYTDKDRVILIVDVLKSNH